MEKLKQTIAAIGFLLLAFAPRSVMAQTDTVNVSETERLRPTQVPLEQCEGVDTCEVKRYAIVSKANKYGIYDLRKHENITEIDLDRLRYYRNVVSEDNDTICYFYAEKGTQSANIGAVNGETVAVWGDNPDYIASIGECTTIDEDISAKCRKELERTMEKMDGNYGQVAVIDAQTGQLKAWVAIQKDDGKYKDSKLYRSSCTSRLVRPMLVAGLLGQANISLEDSVDTECGIINIGDSIVIRDHNWRSGGYGKITYRQGLVNKSNVAMFKVVCHVGKRDGMRIWRRLNTFEKDCDAMELAAVVSSFYKGGKFLIPTLNGDSVTVKDDVPFTPKMLSYMKDILIEANSKGIQAKYAPKSLPIAGLYGTATNEEGEKELSFAGCFPIDEPRYALGVFIDKTGETPSTPKQLSELVNELIEWLSKH